MTPKEKAKQLISTNILTILSEVGNKLTMEEVKKIGKQCALSAIDEIIELYEFHAISKPDDKKVMDILNYFDEVKQEIENGL